MTYLVCTPEEFMSSSFNDRLRYVQKQIHETPEMWNQASWGSQTECGTTHCIAGWTVLLAGGRINYGSGRPTDSCGREVYFQDFGAETLGLNDEEAFLTFYNLDTDLDDLDAWVDRLTARDR